MCRGDTLLVGFVAFIVGAVAATTYWDLFYHDGYHRGHGGIGGNPDCHTIRPPLYSSDPAREGPVSTSEAKYTARAPTTQEVTEGGELDLATYIATIRLHAWIQGVGACAWDG